MRENSRMEFLMVEERLNSRTEVGMKDNSSKASCKAKVRTPLKIVNRPEMA